MALFFNIEIDEKLQKKIVDETNQINSLCYVENASDCQLLMLSIFDIYNGCYFKEESEKLIRMWFETLLYHTSNTYEYIFNNMIKFYYDKGAPDLAVSYVQNHDFSAILHNSINFIGKNNEEKRNNAYLYYLDIVKKEIDAALIFHLKEILFPEYFFITDIKFSVDQRKSTLVNTIRLLQTIEFQNVDIEYKHLLAILESEINSNAKSNTILKFLKKSQLNHVSGEKNIGLYYVHIFNIIHGIYSLKDKMAQYHSIVKILKFEIKSIDDRLYSFKVDNIIRNLTSFYEQIDFDQIDRYVILYYFKEYINEDNIFEFYKKLCSKILNKSFQTLEKNSFNIDKIIKPMNFIKYFYLTNLQNSLGDKEFNLQHNFLCR